MILTNSGKKKINFRAHNRGVLVSTKEMVLYLNKKNIYNAVWTDYANLQTIHSEIK